MGGVAKAVTKVVDFVEDVGDAVGKAVNNIVNNPLPVIETVALSMLGVPPPVANAIVSGMNGGSPEDMLKASVTSSLTAGIAPNVSTALVDAGVNQGVASTLGSAVSGGVRAGLSGGDFTQGALTSGVNTGFNQAMDYLATTANTPTMNTDDLTYKPPESVLPEPTAEVGGLPTLDSSSYDIKPADYSLTGDKSNVPTSDQGLNPAGSYSGLSMDSIAGQAPGFATMGGGSGLATDVNTPLGTAGSFINSPDYATGALGTVSGAGFTDQSAMPALGDPGSFINNPKVTGQPVIGTPACNYNVNVPNVKISALLDQGKQKTPSSTGYEVTGNALNPWLDSSAEMLVNKADPTTMGSTKLLDDTAEKKKKIESLYGQMDACLAKEFQDRYGGVPQITSLGGALGSTDGNFAQPSGYSSALGYACGGTTTCFCLNNNPKYMPKFADCGPSMLQTVASPKRGALTPKQLQHIQQGISAMGNMGGLAQGGLPKKYHDAAPEGHNPEFVTGITGFYACGGGTGQSDDIPAMLHDGDYVMDADVVAALGDGSSKAGREVLEGFRSQIPHKESGGGKPVPAKIADGEYVFPAGFVTALGGGNNKAGAKILDGLREKLRAHKRSAPTSKIPPKAKSPLDYIEGAKG